MLFRSVGFPTTAACPAFAHEVTANATVIERLQQAGAVCMGKTNLDQFATGLVGARSPYGRPSSAFSSAHISGGSSSGSAVVVAVVKFVLRWAPTPQARAACLQASTTSSA